MLVRLLLLLLLVLVCSAGCHRRTLAPELEYEQSEVELIRKEIDSIDWD